MTYHYMYETKCLVNNKIYIGVHSTKNLNDGYLGSGKLLNRAIKKYGVENFQKKVIEFFETKEEAYLKEKEIVNKQFVNKNNTYNITEGGKGSFYHINSNKSLDQGMSKEKRFQQRKLAAAKGGKALKNKLETDVEYRSKHLLLLENNRRKLKEMGLLKTALSQRWVTNPDTKEQKYVHIDKVDDYLKKGWIKGRKGGWGRGRSPKN